MDIEKRALAAAENIEALITIDFRGRGMVRDLIKMVREISDQPPVLTAAKKLKDAGRPGDYVLIVTGLNSRGVMAETDGPVGAALLGRSLALGLKLRPIFLINQEFRDIMSQTARAAGLNVFERKKFHQCKDRVSACSCVLPFPLDDEAAKKEAEGFLNEFAPVSIVSIETRGMNRFGVCHTWNGEDVSYCEPKFNWLFAEARKRGIFSVGIFDGCCTEIGYGKIRDRLLQQFAHLSQCQCNCGGGIVDDTVVDAAIPAAVSNWGAYGIGACLALLLQNERVLHDRDVEVRVIKECADAGAIEGVTGVPTVAVDDLPAAFHGEIVELLRTIVRYNIEGFRIE